VSAGLGLERSARRGGGGGFGGGITSTAPISGSLTPTELSTAYGFSQSSDPTAPAVDVESTPPAAGLAFVAGVAIALLSAWEYRSRQSGTDRRRWTLPIDRFTSL
jgi:hypothetical protein